MTWRVVHPPLSSSGHIQARKKNSSVSGACNSQWTLSEAKCMQRARATGRTTTIFRHHAALDRIGQRLVCG
jgi:hypothetical protein